MNHAELVARVRQLEEQVQEMTALLAQIQPAAFISPAQAAPLLGISRDTLIAKIHRAEELRQNGLPPELRYGIHYQAKSESMIGTLGVRWQVNVAEWKRLKRSVSPENRIVG